jgi:undecaprenyl-diphosphatase
MTYLQALILAIIEGLTEFLPISSTGHMIIGSSLMQINTLTITKIFLINIQFGAILSVLILYWKRFFQSFDFYLKLFVAFLPAAIIGFALGDFIDQWLESVIIVAINLLLGGIVLIFVDNWFSHSENPDNQEIKYSNALVVGFFQCLAMLLPGLSRSAASIIGGMTQKLSRKQAAEFSFFLAVPTMLAASGYRLLKDYDKIQVADIQLLIFGNIVAFVVAMLAIKFFIGFLTKYGFKWFGYYRIILGLLILGLWFAGIELKV